MFPVSDVIPSRTTPYITIGLIALNTSVFLAELLLGDRLPQFIAAVGLVPAAFSPPALVTSMFLHAGWVHVIGNMLYLWIFGDTVEDTLGHGRFLLFYIAAGAAAAVGHIAFNPHSFVPMIGASGAVSAVLGAYFVLYPRSRVLTAVVLLVYVDLVEIHAIFFLGVWFLMQLFSGAASLGVRTEGGVAVWAHVVGFLAGLTVGTATRVLARGRLVYWS